MGESIDVNFEFWHTWYETVWMAEWIVELMPAVNWPKKIPLEMFRYNHGSYLYRPMHWRELAKNVIALILAGYAFLRLGDFLPKSCQIHTETPLNAFIISNVALIIIEHPKLLHSPSIQKQITFCTSRDWLIARFCAVEFSLLSASSSSWPLFTEWSTAWDTSFEFSMLSLNRLHLQLYSPYVMNKQ